MQELITLKTIHQKRKTFLKKSAIFIFIITVLFMAAGSVLFTFVLRILWIAVIVVVSGVTLQTLNRIYSNKMITARNSYIENLFPIKEKLTKEQFQFIISDLEYLFESDIEDSLAALYKKLKTNNLTTKDIEKLNMMYSKQFVDLTVMKT